MRRATYFLFFLIAQFFAVQTFGQTGNYFLSHYSPADENIDYLSFDIVQTDRGVIYFANKSGVIEFDGRNWNVIDSPGAIYTMALTNGNEIYAGGLTGFGKLSLNEDNVMAFESLSGKVNARNIFKCSIVGDRAFFINETHLYALDLKTDEITLDVQSNGGDSFTGLYVLDDIVYVSGISTNLYKLEGSKLVVVSFPFMTGDEFLFVNKLPGTSQYLIGLASGKIFTYEGLTATEIKGEAAEYLLTNVVTTGKWVNDDLIAIGTLSGGVVFINPKTGSTQQIINYYTGLPDNEVFALMTDKNQGVWVAHDYGFTRIAPYLPFRTFNHYPGLSGNLLCAYSDATRVYVGTSVGLFKLNKEEIYSEETYFVTRLREMTTDEEKIERKKSRKGLFGFLKKNKDKVEEEKEPEKKSAVKKVVEKKTRKVLQALDYAYKKVDGIEGKVTHLMNLEGELIAGGVGGVYSINGLESTEIISSPIRAVFHSPTLDQLLVSTYNDRVRTLKKNKNVWEETYLLDTLRTYVGNIFEDHVQNIWLCGRADVVKVELIDGQVSTVSSVPFSTPVLDETMGFSLGPDVFVAASGSFHRYDVIDHQFVRYDSLPGPRKYFTSLGSFWYNDGHRWTTVDQKLKNALRVEWLGLFPDIRSLTVADNGDGLWLITSGNELYKFTRADLKEVGNKYPLFLKEVRGPESKLSASRLLSINEGESALSFEFIRPEFTNAFAIEYQYMIEGINKSWSEWSPSNNVVNFPFLTPGKYKLRIRSRDLFGEVPELQSIDFVVIPPYWRQTWFYALEFIFFGSLVILSLRLSAANNKYRHISQLLSILTVIMLIQLMQNTAESFIPFQTTPVIDFFIQVFIALLILPLESMMRRFMVEASEGKYKLKGIKRIKD